LLAHKSAWTFRKNDIVVIDKIDFKSPSTRDFKILLKNLKIDGKMKVLFISDIDKVDVWKSARNISTVLTTTVDYLLIEDILGAGKILVTQDVLEKIQGGLIK
jgi:large subunit ribosomal protein L4